MEQKPGKVKRRIRKRFIWAFSPPIKIEISEEEYQRIKEIRKPYKW